jgi:hypothetical protein
MKKERMPTPLLVIVGDHHTDKEVLSIQKAAVQAAKHQAESMDIVLSTIEAVGGCQSCTVMSMVGTAMAYVIATTEHPDRAVMALEELLNDAKETVKEMSRDHKEQLKRNGASEAKLQKIYEKGKNNGND